MSVFWTPDQAADVLDALARRAGLVDPGASVVAVDRHSVHARYGTLPDLVRTAGPAFLTCFRTDGPPSVVAVLGPGDLWGRVPVLLPSGGVRRIRISWLVRQLREAVEAAEAPRVEALLDAAGMTGRRRRRARERLLAARLEGRPVGGGLLVRAAPDAPVAAAVRDSRVLPGLALALAARMSGSVVLVGGWWLIGEGALAGRLSLGWVVGWGLLLATGLLLEQASGWGQGLAALRGAVWTKATLLRGAMRADPQRYRAGGVGGALARVSESQALEDLVLSGGLRGLLTLTDLLAALWIFLQLPGPLGSSLVVLLVFGVVVGLFGSLRLWTVQRRWTEGRRELTRVLVERMQGHRTRRLQARDEERVAGEDVLLTRYHGASRRFDDHLLTMGSVLGGGWGALAFAGIGAWFASSAAPSAGVLAAAVGATLLAQGALLALSGALDGLAAAAIAWVEVRPLLAAARRPLPGGRVDLPEAPAAPGSPLIQARGLRFGWEGRPEVLRGVDLELAMGDRVLLTGASGSGKSTLVSLLTGSRRPTEGLLLFRGLDPATARPRSWRAHAVCAPQFHDNHVFEGTLAFNLLLGRSWPPSRQELGEAEGLCRELGLGPLIDRMPAGLGQTVGTSGWQLSHGERSRVFLARALLQDAEVVVLDESFAALDPVLLHQCMAVARRRARTLVVVAHP